MRPLIQLMLNLPWWGNLILIAGLVVLFYVGGWWFRRRFDRIVHEGVLEMGSALRARPSRSIRSKPSLCRPATLLTTSARTMKTSWRALTMNRGMRRE